MSADQQRADFVHLRVHSAYSLLEGAIAVADLPKLCRRHGMPAAALTDSDNLFGALEFAAKMMAAGVQPIVGSAIALRPTPGAPASGHANGGGRRAARPQRLVLLAQNEQGYRHLLKLSSLSYLASAPGQGACVGLEDLAAHGEGLICLSGGAEGPLGALLAAGQTAAAEALLGRLAEIFPQRLYIELQRHGMAAEIATEGGLIDLAYAHDLPLVATNEAYFAGPDMYEAHDALICIAEGGYLAQSARRRLTPEHHFKSAAAMRAAFADLPEAIENTIEIAQRCAFAPRPRQPILPSFPVAAGEDEAGALRRLAERGLEARLAQGACAAPAETYRARLAFELDVIERMKFPGYFLIVADFIQWAKAQDIPVGPGRGSGAGSVVAWALTITDLDPLRFNLLFERFLNPERVSMPDFDIDFCQDRRDEVIRYVQGKYGAERVAQIITFGKLQARAVLRDVGRVLQLPYGQVDRLCKLVPNNPAHPVSLPEAIAGEPRLQQARDQEAAVATLLDIGQRLEGLYRHASTHAAGLVIGDRPLDELVPLYRDPRSDMPVTQFNMKWVEPAGLVKFDFLGLKTLTVIERARRLLAARGVALDLAALPLDDAATFALLGLGETTGVFQLESTGMRDVLRRMKPDSFEDIIAVVALYRPGPMDNIPRYIACKRGQEQPDYLHPWLEPILNETYGVIIYQEQVMQIAQALSGYSLGEADLLRRAMGKKIRAEMAQQKARFVEGALAKGVSAAQADHIFELVAKFAEYGFNKSHAAAYALVAYQTAWLKANHPVEFLAALMSLDDANTDKLGVFRQEVERLGIRLAPPCVNASEVEFSVAEGCIQYALAAIRNVGRHAVEAIVAARRQGGPFRDPCDFAARVDPRALNRRAWENLVRAGAFDALEPDRARLLASLDRLIAYGQACAAARRSDQASLFGEGAAAIAPPALLDAEPWDTAERLRHEFEAVGFFLSAHPLDDYAAALRRGQIVSCAELLAKLARGTQRARLAGTVMARQERRSARGTPFAFVKLTDRSGEYEVMVFAELLQACRDLLEPGRSVVLTVDAEQEDERPRIRVVAVQAIEEVAARTALGLRLVVGAEDALARLRGALATEGRGEIRLVLRLDAAREVELALPGRYAVTPQLCAALRRLPGILAVEEV